MSPGDLGIERRAVTGEELLDPFGGLTHAHFDLSAGKSVQSGARYFVCIGHGPVVPPVARSVRATPKSMLCTCVPRGASSRRTPLVMFHAASSTTP